MTIDLLKNIANEAPIGNLLGLDVGKKTIGLALGTKEQGIATPLHTIKRTKFSKDIQVLKAVIEQYDVEGFIIGYPINMDGTEGPRAQSIRDFAIEVERSLTVSFRTPQAEKSHANQGDSSATLWNDTQDVWIALWDERLSTVSADNIVDNFVEKRKIKTNAKSSGLIDKLAAQSILQGALDFIAEQTSTGE